MSKRIVELEPPAPARVVPPRGMSRELRVALFAAVVVVITTSATTFYLTRPKHDPTPRLDSPIEEVAKFVAGQQFAKLPFERQRLFMTMLEERKEELDRAYRDRKLDAREYRKGLEYAWFGEQLPRMEKYASLTSEEQAAYIDQRLDKKDGKGGKKKKEDGDADASGGGGSTVNAIADAAASDGLVEVRRDEQTEKDIPRTWPPEWREKWKKYREALKDRREEREEEREAAGQPGT